MRTRFRRVIAAAAVAVAAICTLTGPDAAAADGQPLFGPVHLSHAVRANGAVLAPGAYAIRVTADTSEHDRWVELVLVQDGTVVGRELATTVASRDITQIAKQPAPGTGLVRVDALAGDEYVRVWINDGETHYLIHLARG